MIQRNEELLVLIETFRNTLVSRATGGGGDDRTYALARRALLDDPELAHVTPRWVRSCRNLSDFWGMIQPKFGRYHERRDWLRVEMEPIFNVLEGRPPRPADESITERLRDSGAAYVHEMWEKALARREQDPDGAITLARTLLEEVCRFVLDEEGETYDEKAELPKLYGLAAKKLMLAPSQHTEDIVKRILGGCHSIVEGLGALRSRLGDAHAKGRTGAHAAPRHAAFAVNVAGAAASFILETYEYRKTISRPNS
ncbi:abortive infection family protein [Pendulispora rubella]|uniref:Abortive infection family protein n=1 Tax=Pendulispora rubella TaxID=2741070 RepID=A0ABZ2LDK9_9BACT